MNRNIRVVYLQDTDDYRRGDYGYFSPSDAAYMVKHGFCRYSDGPLLDRPKRSARSGISNGDFMYKTKLRRTTAG